MTKRRNFSPEFKHEAVQLTMAPGVTVTQVARELGINRNVLTRWRREIAEEQGEVFTGAGTPRDRELAELRRELARVKKERDFLRDAAAFFARESS